MSGEGELLGEVRAYSVQALQAFITIILRNGRSCQAGGVSGSGPVCRGSGRVAYGTRLKNGQTTQSRGFESHLPRHTVCAAFTSSLRGFDSRPLHLV